MRVNKIHLSLIKVVSHILHLVTSYTCGGWCLIQTPHTCMFRGGLLHWGVVDR